MILCPNQNTKEWKELEKELGKERAYLAFFRNGNDIPTLDQARELMRPEAATKPSTEGVDRYAVPDSEEWNKVYTGTTPDQIRGIEQSLASVFGESVAGSIKAPEKWSATREHVKAVELARELGLEPVFYTSSDSRLDFNGGFVDPRFPERVHINAMSYAPPHYVVAHEGIHSLSLRDPVAYAELRDKLFEQVEGFEEFERRYNEMRTGYGAGELDTVDVEQEFIGDLAGELMTGKFDPRLRPSEFIGDDEQAGKDIAGALRNVAPGKTDLGTTDTPFNRGTFDPTSPNILLTLLSDQKNQEGTPSGWDALMEKAGRKAEKVIEGRIAKDLKRAESQMRKEAEVIVESDPHWTHLKNIIRQGGFSEKYLEALGFGKNMISDLRSVNQKLVTKKGKARADEIAMDSGGYYESADDLMMKIIGMGKRERAVDSAVQALMPEYRNKFDTSGAEAYLEVLNEEIKALSELTGKSTKDWENVPRSGMKKFIEEKVGITTIANAQMVTEHDALKAGLEKTARAAKNAFNRGDKEGALREKIKNREQWIEWYTKLRAKKAFQTIQKDFKKWLRIKPVPEGKKGLPFDYYEKLQDIIGIFDPNVRSARTNRRAEGTREWIKRLQDEGEDPDIPAEYLEALEKVSIGSLPIDDLRVIHAAAKQVIKLGLNKNRWIGRKQTRDFNKIVDETTASIYSHTKEGAPPEKIIPSPDEPQWPHEHYKPRTFFERVGRAVTTADSEILKVRPMAIELDGYRHDGPVLNYTMRQLDDARYQELLIHKADDEALSKVWAPGLKKGLNWLNEKVVVKELGLIFTKEQIMGIIANSGTPRGYSSVKAIGSEKLRRKLSDDEVDLITAKLDREDWDFIINTGRFIDGNHFQELSQVNKILKGIPLAKEKTIPIRTPWGEVPGFYWPLKFDPKASYRVEQREAREGMADPFAEKYRPANPRSGFRIARVQGEAKDPPRLDIIDVTLMHLRDVAHDITHSIPTRNVRKLVADPNFRKAVIDVMGQPYYNMLKPWVHWVARPTREPDSTPERIFNFLRTGITHARIGLKIATAFIHYNLLGLSAAKMIRGGPGEEFSKTAGLEITKAVMNQVFSWLMRKPGELYDYVDERSKAIPEVMKQWDRDRGDIFSARQNPFRKGWRNAVETMAFWPIDTVLTQSIYIAFTTQHKLALMDGLTEEQANLRADDHVRDILPGSSPKDLAAIQRGSELKKMLTTFYTFYGNYYQLIREYAKKGKSDYYSGFGDRVNHYFWGAFYMIGLMALWTHFVRKQEIPSPKDFAKEAALELVGTLPIAREFANALETGRHYSISPAGEAVDALAQLWQEAANEKKHMGRFQLRQAMIVAGVALHMPTDQIEIMLEGAHDLSSGKETNLMYLFVREPSKKQRAEERKSAQQSRRF